MLSGVGCPGFCGSSGGSVALKAQGELWYFGSGGLGCSVRFVGRGDFGCSVGLGLYGPWVLRVTLGFWGLWWPGASVWPECHGFFGGPGSWGPEGSGRTRLHIRNWD